VDARTALGTLRAFGSGIDPADAQLRSAHPHRLEVLEDLLRHAGRQIDKAMIFVDVDMADVAAIEARLVGERADDIPGLHAMGVSDFDPERLEPRALGGRGARAAFPGGFAIRRRTAFPAPRLARQADQASVSRSLAVAWAPHPHEVHIEGS